MVLRTETVLEDERRDAHGVEIRGHLPPFVVHGQRPVPAARRHDNTGPGGTAAGAIDGQRRPVGILGPERARRLAIPERDLLRSGIQRVRPSRRLRRWCLRGERDRYQQGNQKTQRTSHAFSPARSVYQRGSTGSDTGQTRVRHGSNRGLTPADRIADSVIRISLAAGRSGVVGIEWLAGELGASPILRLAGISGATDISKPRPGRPPELGKLLSIQAVRRAARTFPVSHPRVSTAAAALPMERRMCKATCPCSLALRSNPRSLWFCTSSGGNP